MKCAAAIICSARGSVAVEPQPEPGGEAAVVERDHVRARSSGRSRRRRPVGLRHVERRLRRLDASGRRAARSQRAAPITIAAGPPLRRVGGDSVRPGEARRRASSGTTRAASSKTRAARRSQRQRVVVACAGGCLGVAGRSCAGRRSGVVRRRPSTGTAGRRRPRRDSSRGRSSSRGVPSIVTGVPSTPLPSGPSSVTVARAGVRAMPTASVPAWRGVDERAPRRQRAAAARTAAAARRPRRASLARCRAAARSARRPRRRSRAARAALEHRRAAQAREPAERAACG